MVERVGQYELKGVLGGGGMATVYRGEHVSGIGMVAAIKKLHPHLAMDDEFRSRLKVEAQALARLKHRNIVQIFDYVDIDDGCALVTELVEGRTLRAVMAEFSDWPMPLSMALRLFRQILEGMGHAHRHNCLHRDLKPANIMVTSDNEVKVLDFGIANLIDTEAITRTGVSIGTPVYMAPEQLEGRRDLDQRADLYALGMTFWEMLAGHGARPIGERGWRLTNAHVEHLLDREVPVSLVEVVRCLVQVDREDRYNNCDEVLQALSGILAEGSLDEESRIVLAGVGPTTTATNLDTFEFEATGRAPGANPITQTVISQGASALSGISRGKLFAAALILLAVVSGLSLLLGDSEEEVAQQLEADAGLLGEDPAPKGAVDPNSLEAASAAEAIPSELASATLSLLLLSEPPGARMRLDGEDLGSETLIKAVPALPRDYLLTAELAGFHVGSTLCQVDAAVIAEGNLRCVVALRRVAAPAPKQRDVAQSPPQAEPAVQSVDAAPDQVLEGKEKLKIHKID